MNIREKINTFFENFLKDTKNFDAGNFEHLYKLGRLIAYKVPEIIEVRENKYNYVSWKWYEFILKKLDNSFWWELTKWSDNYDLVQCKIVWKGKEYYNWYGVCEPMKKKDGTLLNTKGETLVNENMRNFAKLASRATGLFFHLWIEGDND